MTRVIRTLIVLVALCALAAPAAHASYKSVIKDCAQDGKLDKKYSDADLIKAKKKLPSDLNEYSDCSDVIAAAIGGAGKHGGPGGGGAGGGGGGAAAGGPAAQAAQQQDQNDLNKIVQGGGGPKPKVKVGDHTLTPGKNGLFNTASAENGLPLPLLLALIAMAIVALGGSVYVLRRRIPALARINLPRIPLPRRVSLSRQRR